MLALGAPPVDVEHLAITLPNHLIAMPVAALAYAVVDWRTSHHNASFQVLPDGSERCRLVWITDLLPNTLAELVGSLIEQGSTAIKRTLEARSVGSEG